MGQLQTASRSPATGQHAVHYLAAGFAVVKRGRDKKTGQDVAIKVQHAFRHTAGQPQNVCGS